MQNYKKNNRGGGKKSKKVFNTPSSSLSFRTPSGLRSPNLASRQTASPHVTFGHDGLAPTSLRGAVACEIRRFVGTRHVTSRIALDFLVTFCQEKSNNQKSKNPNFYIKINLTFATLLVSMSILLKMKATKRQSIPHQKTGNQLLQ